MKKFFVLFLLLGFYTVNAQDSTFAREVIAHLSSKQMKGRGYNQHGDKAAALYIRSLLRQNGVKPLAPRYFQKYKVSANQVRNVYFPYKQYTSQNVCGIIPGETDTMMVFTAHYDHLGIDAKGILYPGAHDNASGVAALLDIARIHAKKVPHYTLVFLFFSGEEAGLLGSQYASQHPLIDYNKVRLLINIDMFCGGDEGFMIVNANDEKTTPFVEQMITINNQKNLAATISRRNNAANSDHYWFSKYCPSIFIYTLGGPHGDYHQPGDTCESCGLSHYQDFVQLILALL